MRNESILKFLLTAAIVLVVLMFLNVIALRAMRRQYAPVAGGAASLFNFAGQAKEWLGYVHEWKDLAVENQNLKEQIAHYATDEASNQSLQQENDSLRKALGLASRLKRHLLPAGIFSVSLSPEGHYALINKGSSDGVAVGQTIISPDGQLVGKVADVFSGTSRVVLLDDQSFSATVQVLKGQTKGIIHGALTNGLSLDLVTQADTITEGDTLVTTGDDTIPAGLVVGTVRQVNENDTQLFKKISVDSAIQAQPGSVEVVQ